MQPELVQRTAVAACLVVTACGSPERARTVEPPVSNATAPRSCPPARDVYLASVERDDEMYGKDRPRARWRVPLHLVKNTQLDEERRSRGESLVTIDERTARAAGMPPPPPTMWIALDGVAACKATLDGFYAEDGLVDGITYGVWLAGCSGPKFQSQALALATADASGCELERSSTVAERDGEWRDDGGQQRWQRPTKQQPLPPAFARLVPQRECKEPQCETLWTLDTIDVRGRTAIWMGQVVWLQIGEQPDTDAACAWDRSSFGGLFAADRDGTPRPIVVEEPDRGEDATWEETIGLVGVLADAAGARVLVIYQASAYSTFDLLDDGPKRARTMQTHVPHPEGMSYGFRGVGPACSAL